MWNELQTSGSNGLSRVLQPGYSVMNLRLGVNQVDAHWLTEFYVANLTNKNAVTDFNVRRRPLFL
jgi:outer membrane receptor protein involved in Fe transport